MIVRKRLLVSGTVQGVGFRPAIARAAAGLGPLGLGAQHGPRRRGRGRGRRGAVAAFVERFASYLPPNARVESVEARIDPSPLRRPASPSPSADGAGQSRFSVGPDLGDLPDLPREFADPANRRYRHPFISLRRLRAAL